jgi:hypothetical protein
MFLLIFDNLTAGLDGVLPLAPAELLEPPAEADPAPSSDFSPPTSGLFPLRDPSGLTISHQIIAIVSRY